MDMRVCLAVGIIGCFLVCSHAASIGQQDTRNFIPDRYNIRGTLIHDDGTFTRQDPPPQPADEQQQSMYDQFGGEQTSNLAYQQQDDYQTQDDAPYGQQAFQDYQEPESNSMAGQNEQNAYYNAQQNQQDMPFEQNIQGYAGNSQSYDDLQGQGLEGQSYDTQPQEYQANYNDQEPPESQFQAGQPYYGEQPSLGQEQQIQDYQSSSQKDDIQGSARENIEKAKEKAWEKLLGATKKYKIPKNLSRKDLEGMIGYSKQIYLRGGH